MPAQILRPYQKAGIASVMDAFRRGAKSVLFVLPTGGGKTSCFAHMASEVVAGGKRALLVVHRRELAQQAARRFLEFGTQFGYLMAGTPSNPCARMQIASVQTLVRRTAPRADLVIFDEAHLSTAKTWQAVRDAYPAARLLGVTATPWRLSGKPLVGAYDDCVIAATPSELREQGFLCPYVGFSYLTPDLTGVKTVGGDYNEKQSGEAMKAPQIVDNVVEMWLKHASTLSTVVFNVTVEHSLTVTARFKAAGVRAEHLDGKTSRDQRAAILKRVESGATQVLCNVGIAVEGIDIPRLKCVVLNRPTKSLALMMQQIGRGRRPYEGQTLRIHDHAFNIKLHGLPDDERDYTLNARPELPPSLSECPTCACTYSGTSCPNCGSSEGTVPTERELVTVADAEQFEFASGGEAVSAPRNEKPIDVRWDNVGKVIRGVFEKQWTENTVYGPQKRYLLRGEKRNYNVPGTTRLNALMTRVKVGDSLIVTQLNSTPLSEGRERKEFKLEVDEPDPELERAKRDAEIIRLRIEEPTLSAMDISARVGCSDYTVFAVLKRAGRNRSLAEGRRAGLLDPVKHAATIAAASAISAVARSARSARSADKWRDLAPRIDALVAAGSSIRNALVAVLGRQAGGPTVARYRRFSALPQFRSADSDQAAAL